MAQASYQVTGLTAHSLTLTLNDGNGTVATGQVVELSGSGLDFSQADLTVIGAAHLWLMHLLRAWVAGIVKVKPPTAPSAGVIGAFNGVVVFDDGSVP